MGRSVRSAVWAMLSAAVLMAGSACSGEHYGSAISRSGSAGDGGSGGGGGGGTGGDGGGGGGPAVPPEVDGQLVINEVMAANALTINDETGAARPWIEILNPTDTDVPLRGYGVTDDFAAPVKGVIGDGAVVPARGYLVVWLDGNPEAGPTHVAAYLSKAGGSVGLARPDGSFIDQLGYGAQETDLSAAREPDGAATWAIEWHVSPGAANPVGSGQPGTPAADPEVVPTAGDPSDRILGYDQMPQFSLTIGAAEIQSLMTAPDIYVPATLTYEGRDYGPVGVHLKGMQSFEPIDRKPSLRINVDKFVPAAAFFGLKDLTLNNMHSDFSMMHERIAYWIARTAGVPASRANHALLTVNGQSYGLYTNVETVKKRILSRAFGNNTGSLFEATDVDFRAQYIPFYDLVAGPDDRSLLSGVAAALTATDPGDAMNAAAAYADIDQFTRFWAMCAVVGQLDSFPYSDPGDDYFTYANPVTGRARVHALGDRRELLRGRHRHQLRPFGAGAPVQGIADLLRQVRRQRLGHHGAGRASRLARGARSCGGADRAPRRAGHPQVVPDRAGHDVPRRHVVLHDGSAPEHHGLDSRPERRTAHGRHSAALTATVVTSRTAGGPSPTSPSRRSPRGARRPSASSRRETRGRTASGRTHRGGRPRPAPPAMAAAAPSGP